MSSFDIIPFETTAVPAYLRAKGGNDDLLAHASKGFPVISIKGKTFSVVRGRERTLVMNPKDPDSPATYLEVVLVKASKYTSKIWYAKGYSEGQDSSKPDCFSTTGDKPDPSSTSPQAKSCALCPKNQWGARMTEDGKKAKECQDSVRIAVASLSNLNDVMMLRVPATSIKALGLLGKECQDRGISYSKVLTRIGFNMEEASPKLTFKAIGFLPEAAAHVVDDLAGSDVVATILGQHEDYEEEAEVQVPAPSAESVIEKAKAVAPQVATKDRTVIEEEVVSAVEAAPVPVPEKKTVKAVSVAEEKLSLDSINFDD